jgi:hypothetical protein
MLFAAPHWVIRRHADLYRSKLGLKVMVYHTGEHLVSRVNPDCRTWAKSTRDMRDAILHPASHRFITSE